MRKITIYRFSLYDIHSDELVTSKRWGTLDAIARVGGKVDEASAFETEETSVLSDVIGLTEVGFVPSTGSIICSLREDKVEAETVRS